MKKNIKNTVKIKHIKIVFHALLPSKMMIFSAGMMLLIENIITVGTPFIMMKLIDQINLENINIGILMAICSVFILQLVVASVSAYVLTRISEFLVKGLREKVINKILDLPISYFDKNQTGDIMSRVTSDTMIVKSFVTDEANIFITDTLTLLGSLVLILVIDWKIGLIVLILSPIISLIVALVADREFGVSVLLQEENARFQSFLNQVVSDIRLVKAYVSENLEYRNSRKIINKIYELSLKEGKIMAVIRPFTNSLMLILLVAIFGYGSLRVAQGTLTAGGLIAIILYLFQMSSPVSGIASFYTGYQKFCSSILRLYEIFIFQENNKSNKLSMKIETKGIVLKNVIFEYRDTKRILNGIYLEAKKGKTTAIIGTSGVGKTTLFSLIERFYEPTSGKIYYDGIDIMEIDVKKWRKKISYVSQDSPIMYGTILSNLTYGMEEYTIDKVERAVYDVKLSDYIKSLPNGYNTLVGERGITLSGGQRQRIAIARAMIREPEILLLDEATSHLDSDSENIVKEALEKLMKGRTTLIIAHNMSTIKDADEIVVLENGTITGCGKHEYLVENNLLYRRFIEQQNIEF